MFGFLASYVTALWDIVFVSTQVKGRQRTMRQTIK